MKIHRTIILSLILCLLFPSALAFAQEHQHNFDTVLLKNDSMYSQCSDCGEERPGIDVFLAGNWAYGEGEDVYYITLKEDCTFEAQLKDGEYSGEWLPERYSLNEENETMALELTFYKEIGEEEYEQLPIYLIIMEIKYNAPTAKSVMYGYDSYFKMFSYMTDEQLAELNEDVGNIEELIASKWISERIVTYGSTKDEFPEAEDTDHTLTLNADGTFSGSGPTCGDISGTWTVRDMTRRSEGKYTINLDLQCVERPDISVASIFRSKTYEDLTLMSFTRSPGFCTGYYRPAE